MNCGETGHQQEDVDTWTSFMAGLNRGAQAPLRPGGTRLVGEHRTRRLCRLRVHRPPDRRSLASSLHGRNRRRAMARDLVKWSRVLRREISVSRRHAQRIERADQTFIEAHGAYLIMQHASWSLRSRMRLRPHSRKEGTDQSQRWQEARPSRYFPVPIFRCQAGPPQCHPLLSEQGGYGQTWIPNRWANLMSHVEAV
jgi:hypothetical protein